MMKSSTLSIANNLTPSSNTNALTAAAKKAAEEAAVKEQAEIEAAKAAGTQKCNYMPYYFNTKYASC